ncbi:hypothetical protein ACFZC3_17075 [Streptomyces sp. NPDC007903]|uniref:hypothetical protein n=1 Tax=Streptomyces sp. NPDC007903 TaxID=3364786 RepID=UPI0036E4CED6
MDSCPAHYSFVFRCFDCCRQALSACPGDVDGLTRRDPDAFAEFAREHREWVESLLLAECAHRPLIEWSYPGGPPPLVRWAVCATPAVADVLPVPCAVAVGLARAHQQREGPRSRHETWTSRLLDRLDSHVDQRLAQLWRDLALLAEERDPVAAAGLRHMVEKRARPGLWARSLEWLLLLGRHLEGLDVALTVALADKHRIVRQAVNRCSRSTILRYSCAPGGYGPPPRPQGRSKSGCCTQRPSRRPG